MCYLYVVLPFVVGVIVCVVCTWLTSFENCVPLSLVIFVVCVVSYVVLSAC